MTTREAGALTPRVLLTRTILEFLAAATLSGAAVLNANAQGAVAATPPMGWNSWDSYGLTVREPDVKANAQWMASHLEQYGWKYIVVDEGWYLQNPESGGKPAWNFTLGPDGLYRPAPNRFPSAQGAAGLKPLADYVHSLGLKFGIHIIRGIPRQAVMQNLPIAGSSFRAKDAANQADLCYWQRPDSGNQSGQKIYWNSDNYGVMANAAGQAYYDSMARLYASWGVDLIKVDCISSPYRAEQIHMISRALKNSGRQIVLSLSPGPTALTQAEDVRKYAQMWRISNDILDYWKGADVNPGIRDQFAVAANWAKYAGDGAWPDGDMLPIGYLGPGVSLPRQTRLTRDEQQSLITLWSMFRSPLMIGGNLPSSDQWTTSLLTNPDVIAVDQHSRAGHQVLSADNIVIWVAQGEKQGQQYLAVFNTGDARQTVRRAWKELELENTEYHLVNVWEHQDLGDRNSLALTLEPHACALYRVF